MNTPLESVEYCALRATALFKSLKPQVAAKILAHCIAETHPAGSRLFNQDEPAKSFFLVLDGWVKISRAGVNASETVIGVFTRGQTIADAIAIAGSTYPASAETVTRARLIRVDAGFVREIIRQQPDIALAMIASTAQHLFLLMQQIEQLKAHKAHLRVAEFLLSLTDVHEGPASIALPFDKMLIAARLGMQPESLSRAFSRLRCAGVHVLGAEVKIEDVCHLDAFMRLEPMEKPAARH